MIDDSEGLAALVTLQGRAVISFVRFLVDQGHFSKDSKLRNLGLVLALWVRYAKERVHPDLGEGQDWWQKEIVRLADRYELPIYGPSDIEEILPEIRNELAEDEEEWKATEEEGRELNADDDEADIPEKEDYGGLDSEELTSKKRWGFTKNVNNNK